MYYESMLLQVPREGEGWGEHWTHLSRVEIPSSPAPASQVPGSQCHRHLDVSSVGVFNIILNLLQRASDK